MEHKLAPIAADGSGELIDEHLIEKLRIDYYFDIDRLPFKELFAGLETVLEIKPALVDWLDSVARRDVRGDVHPRAFVEGDVVVEEGAQIEAGAYVEGPAVICAGAVLRSNACIRDHVVIGPRSKIGHCTELTRSVLMADSMATHMAFIGDSVIGNNVNIGSSCVTTNLRVDRPVREPATAEIVLSIEGWTVPTRQTKFGAIIGDRTQLPALISTSPGTLIGPGTIVMPRGQLGGVLPAGTRVR
ncbi:hypothetical protein GCM10010174_59100 [Kutzneria viridogrisea]|uniref:Mannose-1-phosphate guanyltransferase C-terminal domain-containing protein n=2 Tax=Kutzneria TaxID=43356 RepID=W5WB13_9PSEU|nr:hypothetical protein [Kutzneria albida]AHH95394.1 hypothetical protein KALB_2025 [Kutzneria albida DSM 43870]MBA8927247.1 bifunctional UDP-N-acetylglucosamine pyrophosphorylase/glucosamine-1-phosphate N-acetyltransferase [Kutzneria viridogrisea]